MDLYTIGFTQKSAAEFFGALKNAGVRRVVDIRLHNTSHLAGFAKRQDLPYFLAGLCGADYHHEPLLCPTLELLEGVRKHGLPWAEYRAGYLRLLAERAVATRLERALFADRAALLCSEPEPEHCHRSLVVEYLGQHWEDVRAVHL